MTGCFFFFFSFWTSYSWSYCPAKNLRQFVWNMFCMYNVRTALWESQTTSMDQHHSNAQHSSKHVVPQRFFNGHKTVLIHNADAKKGGKKSEHEEKVTFFSTDPGRLSWEMISWVYPVHGCWLKHVETMEDDNLGIVSDFWIQRNYLQLWIIMVRPNASLLLHQTPGLLLDAIPWVCLDRLPSKESFAFTDIVKLALVKDQRTAWQTVMSWAGNMVQPGVHVKHSKDKVEDRGQQCQVVPKKLNANITGESCFLKSMGKNHQTKSQTSSI